MNYIDGMRQICVNGFDELFTDVDVTSGISMVDFPDYPNVGDSAIALGALKYFAQAGITLNSVMCIGSLYPPRVKESRTVYINGGGNIAGFFEGIDNHRNGIAGFLPSDVTLIQGPQSVYWASESARLKFIAEFLRRDGLRMGVRDRTSFDRLVGESFVPTLVPDSVHMLGRIDSPAPSRPYVVLARGDQESSNGVRRFEYMDWLKDERGLEFASRVRWKYRYMGKFGDILNPQPTRWRSIAEMRLSRGVGMLSVGESVVTDRLHAMLIALQMGRRVVAVDNNNQKLSNYAKTWFSDFKVDVEFADSIEQAIELV